MNRSWKRPGDAGRRPSRPERRSSRPFWPVSIARGGHVARAGRHARACDIAATAGTSCVAAYSSVRALYQTYNGTALPGERQSDGTTTNISTLAAEGTPTPPRRTLLLRRHRVHGHDRLRPVGERQPPHRSPRSGSRARATSGCARMRCPSSPRDTTSTDCCSTPAPASARWSGPTSRPARSRSRSTRCSSGTYITQVDRCCFGFGNAETIADNTGSAHMDALNISTVCTAAPCNGVGPWWQADLENGTFMSGGGTNPANISMGFNKPFVTGFLRNNGTTNFALDGGDANGATLTSLYSGALPSATTRCSRRAASSSDRRRQQQRGVRCLLRGRDADRVGVQRDRRQHPDQHRRGRVHGHHRGWYRCSDRATQRAVSASTSRATMSGQTARRCRSGPVSTTRSTSAGPRRTDWSPGRSSRSGRCLDVTGGATASGTPIQLYDCNGNAAQVWTQQANGTLINPNSGKCLTSPAGSTTNGTQLVIDTCGDVGVPEVLGRLPAPAGERAGRQVPGCRGSQQRHASAPTW